MYLYSIQRIVGCDVKTLQIIGSDNFKDFHTGHLPSLVLIPGALLNVNLL
jgi:hypothetical protein